MAAKDSTHLARNESSRLNGDTNARNEEPMSLANVTQTRGAMK